MLQIVDEVIGDSEGVVLGVDLEKVVLNLDKPSINLRLEEWDKRGICIDIAMKGFGYSKYKSYEDMSTAKAEYESLKEKINNGCYKIEIKGKDDIKLLVE